MIAKVTIFSRELAWQHVAAAVFATVCGLAMAWGRLAPVEILTTDISPQILHPGDRFEVRHQIHWRRTDCRWITLTGNLIDSLGFSHAMEAMFLGRPHLQSYTARPRVVPFNLPWGRTIYREGLTISCFPFYDLWPIIEELAPTTFQVVPKENPK